MGYGLEYLLQDYGITLEELADQSLAEGTSPAVCTECGYTTDMEPDQERGWCEVCEANTVVSGLVLAGMI